ncbi:hypothetical protein HMPREF3156_01388 [Neisseria sp. HMSC06F02]|nr:hypothetical protein HMPREF3156_01388 [Neisseria sp. HMSC06F02]
MYVDCFLYFGRHLSSGLVRWQRGRLKRFYGVFSVLGNAVFLFDMCISTLYTSCVNLLWVVSSFKKTAQLIVRFVMVSI